MVKILDCTTRDGGHQTNWEFDNTFVNNLVTTLNQNGTEFYEIGYRNRKDKENKGRFFYCTQELLKDFNRIKNNLQIGVMTDTSRFSFEDFPSAEDDCIDFVRIACHPDKIKETLNIASELHSAGYKIFVQLMEIPNVSKKEYEILEKWQNKDILESLYIADSYSTVKPQDIKGFFDKLHQIGYERISFHAHNACGLALENTLEAIKLGAYSVDVTQNGLGGNLDSKELLKYHF